MFKLNRALSRTTGRAITPSSRPVQELPGFDTTLPAMFPEPPDLDRLTADVLGQLQQLTSRNAVDGAHGPVLDRLTASAMAPYYEQAFQHFSTSVRIVEQIDQQAVETAVTTFDRAINARDAAETAELAADAVHTANLGRERARTADPEATDWEALRGKLRAHRLTLRSDQGILAFLDRGFRGGEPRPAISDPLDNIAGTPAIPTTAPTTSSVARQLSLVDPADDATLTDNHPGANREEPA